MTTKSISTKLMLYCLLMIFGAFMSGLAGLLAWSYLSTTREHLTTFDWMVVVGGMFGWVLSWPYVIEQTRTEWKE